MTDCHTLIIGGGPGGYSLAAAEAAKGCEVVLIEKDLLGGTCLNRGCIPTKCLCAAASALADTRAAASLGVDAASVAFNAEVCRQHKTAVVDSLRADIEGLLKNVRVLNAEAVVNPDGTITAAGEVFRAVRTVVATGSKPAALPIPGAELCATSDRMLALDRVPDALAVIGGGVIGLELASAYADFGAQVTVVEFLGEILPGFDSDIARRLRSMLQRRGIRIVTSAAATSVVRNGEGRLTLSYTSRGKEQSLDADEVLMAVGRRAVLPAGLAEAGVEIDAKGRVVVDASMESSRPGFYAIGDCAAGYPMLAHVAEAQAKILEGNEEVDLFCVPSVIYTRPEAFAAGLTETAAREKGFDIAVRKVPVAANGYARAIGKADGLIKTIVDAATGCVLGLHYVGPMADTLVGMAQYAVATAMTAAQLRAIIHAHPTLTELLPAAL